MRSVDVKGDPLDALHRSAQAIVSVFCMLLQDCITERWFTSGYVRDHAGYSECSMHLYSKL